MQTELSFLWDLYNQILKEKNYVTDNEYQLFVDIDGILSTIKTRIDELVK